MADLRRRKPDDDSGKQIDDDNFNATKPCIGDGTNGSDDEQPHYKKASGLTTADSSDHVNINNWFFDSEFVFFFVSFSIKKWIVKLKMAKPFQILYSVLFQSVDFCFVLFIVSHGEKNIDIVAFNKLIVTFSAYCVRQ